MYHSAYVILLIAELTLAPIVFILLLFITAPYGRFRRKGWGPKLPSRTAWMLMESPSLILPLIITFSRTPTVYSLIFLLIWEIHYFHRTVIYPFRISDPSKPFSLVIMSWGFLFNVMNSSINFYALNYMGREYPVHWFIHGRFLAGVLLFSAGYLINKHSDSLLRNLRKKGDANYAIPRGGLYRWVSSPYYLGEIVEWGGWALMTWSAAGAAFFLFTIGNLFPRALKNHKWYKETFSDYPAGRKAIIPFLW